MEPPQVNDVIISIEIVGLKPNTEFLKKNTKHPFSLWAQQSFIISPDRSR
jgi:hypothetical protein